MANDVTPTAEQRITLAREAQERMIGRARSWLEDSKVKASLQANQTDGLEHQKAS